jgi:preprotein translocase subunit SecA
MIFEKLIKGKYEKKVGYIRDEGKKLVFCSDEELMNKIQKLKRRVIDEKSLENITIEWFAIVQEMSNRKIGLRHFDTQILAGLYLMDGNVVEMKTGEGKTLASTLPLSIKALEKKGTHLITVNEYLAERDEKTMGKVYKSLGLSSGLVKNSNSLREKQENYNCDITYITNSEIVFDYLKDCSTLKKNEIVQRPFHYCVIDEIDSILIDESRTPFILSSQNSAFQNIKLEIAKKIVNYLEKTIDFVIEEKNKDLSLTEKGYKKAETLLKNLLEKNDLSLYDLDNPWINYILNALRAKSFYILNRDYIILNKKILIVDKFTGRILPDRRWETGIHEAIETKENLPIKGGSRTSVSITYQNFFPLYPKCSGMTGTAKTVEKELKDIYDLNVFVLPTIKPTIRTDFSDKLYKTERAKWKAILQESIESYKRGQPVLIGTTSIEKSEFLSDLFRKANIPHQTLNAKPENLKRENQIIAQAGEVGSVTIATNMAGRGTDILLGGNYKFRIQQFLLKTILSNYPQLRISFSIEELFIQDDALNRSFEIMTNHAFPYLQSVLQEYKKKQKISQLIQDVENLPYSLETVEASLQKWYTDLENFSWMVWSNENTRVKKLGGLKVLGSERHENRRIDDQLRGRSGRQGDPGSSQFFLSLQDELFLLFGKNTIQTANRILKDFPEYEAIDLNYFSNSIGRAQETIESLNYEARKAIFEYDFLLNYQFQLFFECRREVLFKKNTLQIISKYKQKLINYQPKNFGLSFFFRKKVPFFGFLFNSSWFQKLQKILNFQKLFEPYSPSFSNYDFSSIWDQNENQVDNQLKISKKKSLQIFDQLWANHLEILQYIRETNNWKSLGQQNPLNEYNLAAFQAFLELFQELENSFLQKESTLQSVTQTKKKSIYLFFDKKQTVNKSFNNSHIQ